MEAFVSAVIILTVVGLGIGIMVGQIRPEDVLKRLVWVLALVLAACTVVLAVRDIFLPVLIPALQSTLVLALKFLVILLALMLVVAIIAALIGRYVHASFGRRS